MRVVAVTGGIASGKSTVVRRLAERLGAPWVSCDAVVDGLYAHAQVLAAVRERFGENAFPGGNLDRRALGRLVFSDADSRRWLEQLLHPLVLDALESWKAALEAQSPREWAIVEVPLLYEVDFPLNRDIDMVVGCSRSTQIERIRRRDLLSEDQARRRIGAQLPIEHKVIRADVVLWNDGSNAVLEQLIGLAAARLQAITS